MIFDLIIGVVMGLLTGVLGLLPDYDPNFLGFGSGLGSAIAGANSVFPVVTLGICIAVILGLRMFLLAVAFLVWLWDLVPFTFK